jgi:hypothetical protein
MNMQHMWIILRDTEGANCELNRPRVKVAYDFPGLSATCDREASIVAEPTIHVLCSGLPESVSKVLEIPR